MKRNEWHARTLRRLLDELAWQAMELGRVPAEHRRRSDAFCQFVHKWRRKAPWECIGFLRIKRQIESVELAIRVIEGKELQ